MHASDLWHSSAAGPVLLRTLLTPLSWLYAAGWQAYRGLYRIGLKAAKEPHRPVVVIGNLTVGGTGKTPITLLVYDVMLLGGRTVVVSSSGYGSPRAEAATLAPEGPLSAAEWGDEAAMLRWFRPEMPLIVGRNRVRAAEIARASHPDAVLLLDDGFQHLPLRKHLGILLDDEAPTNRRCLPAGPYREPRRNRKLADVVLPRDFEVDWSLAGPVDPETREPLQEDERWATLLSAIGSPERLRQSLNSAGWRITSEIRRPDHDPLTQGNLLEAVDPNVLLLTTAKDWVKLRERPEVGRYRIGVVWNEPRFAALDRFREKLDAALAQIQ